MSVLDQIFSATNALVSLDSYFDQLQQASFNGVPFVTKSNSTTVGRRTAEHIYPFRDQPWIEDLGRKARRYHIVGFLIGDDVISQRDDMQNALEYPGPGILIHPTYGRLTVTALDQCTFEEDMTHGRVIEMNLVFEESGLKIFPGIQVSTGNNVLSFVSNANAAINDDFVSQVTSAIQSGATAVGTAVTTVSQWVGQAEKLGNDATNIFHLAAGLNGSFGRFFGGSTGSGSGSISGGFVSPSQVAFQVKSLISDGAAARSAISSAGSSVISVVGDL